MRGVSGYIIIVLLALSSAWPLQGRAKGHYTAFHYERANGFPGNRVYHVFQDRRGYIWMGTDNGLVCFNGYEFKTYTTRDGLPGNEVFNFVEDSSGRLWLGAFSNELSYWREGKIYNNHNDSFLSRLRFKTMRANAPVFDCYGNMWSFEFWPRQLIRIDRAGQITRQDEINGQNIHMALFITINSTGHLIAISNMHVYEYLKDHFELILALPEDAFNHRHANIDYALAIELSWITRDSFLKRYGYKINRQTKNIYWTPEELHILNAIDRLSPDLIGLSLRDGAYLKEIATGKTIGYFLAGYDVSGSYMARDGSLWFSTLGQGVFHYTRSFIDVLPSRTPSQSIRFIKAQKDGICFIEGENILGQISVHKQTRAVSVKHYLLNDEQHGHYRFFYAGHNRAGHWIFSGYRLLEYIHPSGKPVGIYNVPVFKDVMEEDDRHVLAATQSGIYRVDKDKLRITDTFYNVRATAIEKIGTTIYGGTLTGLIAIGPDKKILIPREPALNCHITALEADQDSLLWVANNKAALIALHNGRIVKTIDGQTGLGCNSISKLNADGTFLWVATDNGLYAVNKRPPFNVVRRLSAADGLSSDQVDCIALKDGYVWVGTEKGINYFEEAEVKPVMSNPVFLVNGIRNDSTTIALSAGTMQLANKSLYIDFDVIDHSGITKPVYAYQLNKGDWIDTRNSDLYFPTTPYGHFTVSLKATAASWEAPKMLFLSFYRPYPFYLSWWFILLIVLLFLALISSLFHLFLRRVRKQDRSRLMIEQNLLQLEQMALQGQMNPHFIFNCITAMRQYYTEGDIQKADKFVDAFSSLIRTTFEMADRTFISLEQELHYLRQYLAIERERFEYSFDFTITNHTTTAPAAIPVPAMLLQPLVENAVRHGVRHLPDGTGKIDVTVTQQEYMIHITIADNGIGRAATRLMKQTTGAAPVTSTSVNRKRIDIFNRLFDQKISMHTEDITDQEDRVAGTIILISYPVDIYAFG